MSRRCSSTRRPDYETPTEEEVEDRRPRDTEEEESLVPAMPSSIEEVRETDMDQSQPEEEEGARPSLIRTSDDGLRGAASGNVAVLEIRAPVLRKLARTAILKFMEARERYLRTFRDAGTGGSPMNLVAMIETTVLGIRLRGRARRGRLKTSRIVSSGSGSARP